MRECGCQKRRRDLGAVRANNQVTNNLVGFHRVAFLEISVRTCRSKDFVDLGKILIANMTASSKARAAKKARATLIIAAASRPILVTPSPDFVVL